MPTQCNTKPLEFEPHGRRRVVAASDGAPIILGWLGDGLGEKCRSTVVGLPAFTLSHRSVDKL